MIYVIRRDKKGRLYELFDTASGKSSRAVEGKVIYAISRGIKIENYDLVGSNLIYTQGSESKLPEFGSGNSIFVVMKLKANGDNSLYKCIIVGANGSVARNLSIGDIRSLIQAGASCINAHLVESSDKVEYIAFNKGNIPVIELKDTKPKPVYNSIMEDTGTGDKPVYSRVREDTTTLNEYTYTEDKPIEDLSKAEMEFIGEQSKRSTEDILNDYKDDGAPSTNKYISTKARGKFGSKIKSCLILGLMAATILTGAVGCSSSTNGQATNLNQPYGVTETKMPVYSVQEINEKLNNADRIECSVKFLSAGYKGTISVDGEDLLKIEGKWLKLTDELVITDMNGNVLAKSQEEYKLFTNENWVMKDADDNITYTLKGNFGIRRAQYTIKDSSGTEIGELNADILTLTGDGSIKDTEGNEMYSIDGMGMVNRGFTIVKSDDSEESIDGIDLVLMSCSYRSEIQRKRASSSKSH